MSRTASVRITRFIEDGVEWHRMVVDVGAQHREPTMAFRTLGGLCTLLADILAEELDEGTRVVALNGGCRGR